MKSRFLFAFLMPFIVGCDAADPCENTISQTLTSPDGTRKAIVFTRGCGATTGEYTQVSILRIGSVLDRSAGNVLQMDNDDAVSVSWQNARTLRIKIPATAKNVSREPLVDGISVVYN